MTISRFEGGKLPTFAEAMADPTGKKAIALLAARLKKRAPANDEGHNNLKGEPE